MKRSLSNYSWLCLALGLAACTNPISAEMRSIGFTPNPIPSDNILLGTLYRVEPSTTGFGRSKLTTLCNPLTIDPNYLKEAVPGQLGNWSRLATQDISRIKKSSTDGNVTIEPEQLKAINARANMQGNLIRNVYLTITDAEIYDMSLSDFLKMAQHLADADAESPNGCKNLLKRYEGQTEGLMRLFVATVTYRVDAQNASSINANADFQRIMSTQLGAKYDSTTNSFVSGTQMVYGWQSEPVQNLQLQ